MSHATNYLATSRWWSACDINPTGTLPPHFIVKMAAIYRYQYNNQIHKIKMKDNNGPPQWAYRLASLAIQEHRPVHMILWGQCFSSNACFCIHLNLTVCLNLISLCFFPFLLVCGRCLKWELMAGFQGFVTHGSRIVLTTYWTILKFHVLLRENLDYAQLTTKARLPFWRTRIIIK